jgi:hypothetical protein
MLKRHLNHDQAERDQRRTVIPVPRTDAMFPGWGVKF